MLELPDEVDIDYDAWGKEYREYTARNAPVVKPRPYARGKNSCFWKGGVSFEPYCEKFNNKFK